MAFWGKLRPVVEWFDGPRALLIDIVLAAGATYLGVADRASDPRPLLWPVAGAVVVGLALLVRRRFPLVVLLLCDAALIFLHINLTPCILAVYTIASRKGPASWLTWGGSVVTAGVVLVPQDIHWADDWRYVALTVGLFMLVPLFAGFWMYGRRKLVTALRDRAETAERERDLLAERAVAAERRRIAGEMHDVVAHRVSVIAVQAGGLTMYLKDKQAVDAAEVIRKNSTAALSELRDVLRVLRAEDARPAPPPGLDGIRVLVEDVRSNGTAVDLTLPDPVPDAPVPIGRAAYRVAQEALTNVGKHAPGAPVRVSVSAPGDELVVEVVNGRGGRTAPLPSSGYGLVGMRERVELAGGHVRSGGTDEGGFLVRATFPLREPEQA